jgi:hypothetical protein
MEFFASGAEAAFIMLDCINNSELLYGKFKELVFGSVVA